MKSACLAGLAAAVCFLAGIPAQAATVAAGGRHTLVRSSDGRVWAWGDHRRGQLGTGAAAAGSTIPVLVDSLSDVVAVAAGSEHSMALTAHGAVLTWGAGDHGQLGDGSGTFRRQPQRVPGLGRIVAIAAGARHSLALDEGGSVWAWGDGSAGQLGYPALGEAKPRKLALTAIKAIGAGESHSLAVSADGSAWAWGDDGALDANAAPALPRRVAGLDSVIGVAGGTRFSLALRRDGTVVAWGQGAFGQLGTGDEAPRGQPAIVPALTGVTAIAAGGAHALAVTSEGLLLAWGSGAQGQLGYGAARSTQPRHVPGLTTIEVAAGSGGHSVAVTVDGVIWSWGDNSSGQVGDGTDTRRKWPTQITDTGYACLVGTPMLVPPGGAFSAPVRVTARCASPGAAIHYTTNGLDPSADDPLLSAESALVVDRTTTVKARAFRKGMPASNVAFGTYVLAGVPGTSPDTTQEKARVGVATPNTLGPIVSGTLAAGLAHSLVLKSDGTVWGFGANGSGQLGDNTTVAKLYPVQVSGLTGVTAIAAGAYHSVALKSDGSIWSWGQGTYGQIGDNTTGGRLVPVQVLTGAVAIAAGANHTLAVKTDGSVWAWGLNASGQIGDNTAGTNRLVPVQVQGSFTGAVKVAAGSSHSLALKSNGTVFAWGDNAGGQIGDGTITQRLTPVQVDGASSIVNVSAGRSAMPLGVTSLAVRDDGAVLGWGGNGGAQIGDGTQLTPRLTAVRTLISGIGAIAAGEEHGLAVKSDGTLWSWGQNGNGQIGDGTTTLRPSPVTLVAPASVVGVAAGGSHSLAVTDDGSLWAWGMNTSGQLGDGTLAQRTAPVKIADAGFAWKVGLPVLSPAAGTYGANQTVTVTCPTPGAVLHYTTDGSEPLETDLIVASGGTVSVAQDRTLKVKGWKATWAPSSTASEAYVLKVATPSAAPAGGSYGAGQNVTLTCSTSGSSIKYTTDGTEPNGSSTPYTGPVPITATTTLKAKGFKANWTTSDTRTDVYTLNLGSLTAPSITPAAGTYVDSVQVSMSGPAGATIRYTTDGTDPGGGSTVYTAPFPVTVTTTVKAKAFDSSHSPSATTTNVYTVKVGVPVLTPGAGTYAMGQLVTASGPAGSTLRYTVNGADPLDTDLIFPVEGVVPVANATLKVKALRSGCTNSDTTSASYTITGSATGGGVAAGYFHSIAFSASGGAWGSGYNMYGQMGDTTQVTPRLSPVAVSGGTTVTMVGAGENHSIVLKSNGTAWAFGYNSSGQLGDGSTTVRPTPVQFGSLNTLTAAAAGGNHTVVLTSGGVVWTSGANGSGQLGIGNTNAQSSPVQVAALTTPTAYTITAIAAGYNHTLALTSTGTVWAFGANGSGQLGDNSNTNRTLPVQVSGLTGAVAIAAGRDHSLALKSDGTMMAWGSNADGCLGDGTSTPRWTPVAVLKLSGVRSIAAGWGHSVASRADGTAWSLGGNGSGQLGNNSTAPSGTPVQASGLSGVVGVASDTYHTLAIDKDGAFWGWGANSQGGLGDGTAANRWVPTRISDPGADWKVATPTLSPAGGAFTSSQNVVVSCLTAGATINYTTSGVDPLPGDASVVSGGTVTVGSTLTLKAKAFKASTPSSNVAAGSFTLTVVAPTANPPGNTYAANQTVTLSSTTPGTTIRYTTDGTVPNGSSTQYTAPLLIDHSLTLRAFATKANWSDSNALMAGYVMKVATPVLNPAGGSYSSAQSVTVSTTTPGAVLHYTTNGQSPTEGDPVVTSGSTVLVDRSSTLQVIGWKGGGWTTSDPVSAAYVLTIGTVATPTFSPAAGTYSTPQSVKISTATAGALIRYTTDGTDPGFTSKIYYAPLTVDWTTTLKAKAFKRDMTGSGVGSAAYTIQPANTVAPVTFSPAPGAYTTAQAVTLTSATSGSTIYYTTSGLDPTQGDSWVASGGSISVDRSRTIKAKAFFTGMTASPTRRADYFVTGAVAAAYEHAFALKVDGTLWGFGVNGQGQIGTGNTTNVTTPAQVRTSASVFLTDVRSVAVAGDVSLGHSLAVTGNGHLWSWGDNGSGALCDGTSGTARLYAVDTGVTSVKSVSAGAFHTVILKTDASVWTCGINTHGELGIGTSGGPAQTSPVQVTGLSDVVAVAAGYYHSLALKRDGTLYAWGYGYYGQIGDGGSGSGGQRNSPTAVAGLRGVVAITAGGLHSTALRTEGTDSSELWLWGYDDVSQLGDGASGVSAQRLLPMRGPTGALSLSAARSQTLFTMADGTAQGALWGTGGHKGNNLNPNMPSSSTRFVRIAQGDYVASAAGDMFSLALKRDTTVVSWGTSLFAGAGNGLVLGYSTGTDDPDGDGLSTNVELALGTDPWNADTNGDGLSDGQAVASGKSPTSPDMDGDGVFNAAEIASGTDPFNPDTDGDAVGDGADCFPLDATRSTCPTPTPGDVTPPVITLTEPTNATLISSVP